MHRTDTSLNSKVLVNLGHPGVLCARCSNTTKAVGGTGLRRTWVFPVPAVDGGRGHRLHPMHRGAGKATPIVSSSQHRVTISNAAALWRIVGGRLARAVCGGELVGESQSDLEYCMRSMVSGAARLDFGSTTGSRGGAVRLRAGIRREP